jgi:integrase-like protein
MHEIRKRELGFDCAGFNAACHAATRVAESVCQVNSYPNMPVRPENIAPETPGRKTVRRKRFQRGCVRKVRHGRRWVWIGKYRENGIGRTKVLGHCADDRGRSMGEAVGTPTSLNEWAGQRQALPTNFRAYVSNVYLPQRRKKWKDSTDQTTTERIGTHLVPAFDSFELGDLTRHRLQTFLDEKARSLSRSMVSHLCWDLNAIFKDGCGGRDRSRQSRRFARYAERSEDSGQAYDD